MMKNNLRVHVQIVHFESSLWEFTLRVYFETELWDEALMRSSSSIFDIERSLWEFERLLWISTLRARRGNKMRHSWFGEVTFWNFSLRVDDDKQWFESSCSDNLLWEFTWRVHFVCLLWDWSLKWRNVMRSSSSVFDVERSLWEFASTVHFTWFLALVHISNKYQHDWREYLIWVILGSLMGVCVCRCWLKSWAKIDQLWMFAQWKIQARKKEGAVV